MNTSTSANHGANSDRMASNNAVQSNARQDRPRAPHRGLQAPDATMDACESLYDQPAVYFTLRLFLKQNTLMPGRLIADLATTYLADLVLPPCRPKWLWTKRARDDAKLNTGDFSERRWNAAVKKIVSGEFSARARAKVSRG